MNVVNPVAGSPGSLYAATVTYRTRVTFAILDVSYLPNTNCYQLTDPEGVEGLLDLSSDKLSNLLMVAKKIG